MLWMRWLRVTQDQNIAENVQILAFCLEIYLYHKQYHTVPIFIFLYYLQEGIHTCVSGTLLNLAMKPAHFCRALPASAMQQSSHRGSKGWSKCPRNRIQAWKPQKLCRSRGCLTGSSCLLSHRRVFFRQATLTGCSARSLAVVCKCIHLEIQWKPHSACAAICTSNIIGLVGSFWFYFSNPGFSAFLNSTTGILHVRWFFLIT